MKLEDWSHICRKAWDNNFGYLQKNRFAKIGEGRYNIRKYNKTSFVDCTPSLTETKTFYFLYRNLLYSTKNKDEIKDLDELEDLQSKVIQVRIVEKLGK